MPNPLPFKRDHYFGTRMNLLVKAHKAMTGDGPSAHCTFIDEGARKCFSRLNNNHTIQEKLLYRMAHGTGHVKSFPRDILSIRHRWIDEKPERRRPFHVDGRWPPIRLGVGDASTWRFFCKTHDREAFRPIEHDDAEPSLHLLDDCELTDEQYFLFAFRIWLKVVTELAGVGRARDVAIPRRVPNRAASVKLMQYREGTRRAARYKHLFYKHYHSGQFRSLIETPVKRTVHLPVQLAVADVYSRISGHPFLTIYPVMSAVSEAGHYEHRVIVSHLPPEIEDTAASMQKLTRLLDDVGRRDDGAQEFLVEIFNTTRNVFLSDRYDVELPDQVRARIEERVSANVLKEFRSIFPGLI